MKFGIRYLLVVTAIAAAGAAILGTFGFSIFLVSAVLVWPVVIGFVVEASMMEPGRKTRTISISSVMVLLFSSLHFAAKINSYFAIMMLAFGLLVVCAAWAPQFLLITMLHDAAENSKRSDYE